MPQPLTSNIDRVAYEVLLNGTALPDNYPVLSINVERGIMRIPRATVVLLIERKTTGDETFEPASKDIFLPGKEIKIQAGYQAGSERSLLFEGVIVNLGMESHREGNSGVLVLRCCDKAIKLTLGHKSRYFEKKNDKQILTEIISDHGLQGEIEATEPDYTHDLLIQYQSIDFDFIITRAEANGMLAYMEGGKICIQPPGFDSSPAFELDFEGAGVLSFDFQLEARHQLDKVSCTAWDIKKQALEKADSQPVDGLPQSVALTLNKLKESVGGPASERFTGGFLETQELQLWANGELTKSRLTAFNGQVRFFGDVTALPKLNETITLKGFSSRYNGPVLVTHVKEEIKNNTWTTTLGFGLSPQWHYEEWPVSMPAAGGLVPGVQGLLVGVVKKIDADPMNEHRIQVEVPALGVKGDQLLWARLIQPYATNQKGIVFYPEIGDEVIVSFMHNDPRFAVILGSVYSSSNAPPYPPDQTNSIKAIVTKNDLKLEFDDENKVITLVTPGENQIIISDKDKSILIKDQNSNQVKMDSAGIALESNKDIKLSAKGNIILEAKSKLTGKGTAGVTMEGAKIEIKAQAQLKASASGQAEFSSSGMTSVKAGGILQVQGSLVKIN